MRLDFLVCASMQVMTHARAAFSAWNSSTRGSVSCDPNPGVFPKGHAANARRSSRRRIKRSEGDPFQDRPQT